MPIDPRVIILIGANGLLLFLTLLVNSALAPFALELVLLGPMVVIPALYLRHSSFFVCALLSGLWVDAALPVPFGLFTFAFLCAGTVLFLGRKRFRTEHNYHPVILAHLINFAAILLLAATAGLSAFVLPEFWMQTLGVLGLSHLALLFIAPWFFNLERLLFEVCRVEREPEDFPLT